MTCRFSQLDWSGVVVVRLAGMGDRYPINSISPPTTMNEIIRARVPLSLRSLVNNLSSTAASNTAPAIHQYRSCTRREKFITTSAQTVHRIDSAIWTTPEFHSDVRSLPPPP